MQYQALPGSLALYILVTKMLQCWLCLKAGQRLFSFQYVIIREKGYSSFQLSQVCTG